MLGMLSPCRREGAPRDSGLPPTTTEAVLETLTVQAVSSDTALALIL